MREIQQEEDIIVHFHMTQLYKIAMEYGQHLTFLNINCLKLIS